MTLRRLFVGMTVMFGLSVLSWVRVDGNPSHAAAGEPASVEPAAEAEGEGGNHDNATYRYRTNQSHHWRQILIGGH